MTPAEKIALRELGTSISRTLDALSSQFLAVGDIAREIGVDRLLRMTRGLRCDVDAIRDSLVRSGVATAMFTGRELRTTDDKTAGGPGCIACPDADRPAAE